MLSFMRMASGVPWGDGRWGENQELVDAEAQEEKRVLQEK